MAWTQADLDELDAAIASGTKSVRLDGRMREFHSASEMLQIRAVVARSLSSEPKTTLATTRKGF